MGAFDLGVVMDMEFKVEGFKAATDPDPGYDRYWFFLACILVVFFPNLLLFW
jgi:hypothetical protein